PTTSVKARQQRGTAAFLVFPARAARARLVAADFLGTDRLLLAGTPPEPGDGDDDAGQSLDDLPPRLRRDGGFDLSIAHERDDRIDEQPGLFVPSQRRPRRLAPYDAEAESECPIPAPIGVAAGEQEGLMAIAIENPPGDGVPIAHDEAHDEAQLR